VPPRTPGLPRAHGYRLPLGSCLLDNDIYACPKRISLTRLMTNLGWFQGARIRNHQTDWRQQYKL